ncbi:tRNA 2-thiouridine(34) synthase MnmA [Candidatus Omnitrophota bacterium]
MRKNKRVVVAMSGGVDSSVAAWLLKQRGFEVIGITMCFNPPSQNESLKLNKLADSPDEYAEIIGDNFGISYESGSISKNLRRKRPSCCGIEGIQDAKRVAEKIGIKHYVLNFGKELEKQIIDNFCREYVKGRTPNPCVRCNQFLKFDALFRKAKTFDAQFLATGHYARIAQNRKTKQFVLKKGKDKNKDQSYFLHGIRHKDLKHILMPLGDHTKQQVREIAKKIGIRVADKPASQEICFIDTDYRRFLKRRLPRMKIQVQPGSIVDTSGKVIGIHRGICYYTIGQREGLGIALGYRAYVVRIDLKNNTIVVGKESELFSQGLVAAHVNFLNISKPKHSFTAQVNIRYSHKQFSARVFPLGRRRVKVEFLKPQRAVTPGQSVVFYNRDMLLGGGIIKEPL